MTLGTRAWIRLAAASAVLALASCGAGLISAGVFSSQNDPQPGPENSISLTEARGPLVLDSGEIYLRTAVLRGPRTEGIDEFQLELQQGGAGSGASSLQNLLIVDRAGGEVQLGFALATDEIRATVADPTVADVDVDLVVSGRSEADPNFAELYRTPFRLLRQPALELVPDDPQVGNRIVPVSGGEVVLRVSALPSSDPRDLRVEIVTNDPSPPPGSSPGPGSVLIRQGSNLETSPGTQPGEVEIRCLVPASSYPTVAFVRVWHALAGRSTVVSNLVYRPELVAVVARRGAVEGGDLVTLTGRGLVPIDFSVSPPRLAFDRIQVSFRKDGRLVNVPADDLRPALSSLNTIVCTTPASPDGRPGTAEVGLSLVAGSNIDVRAQGVFAYAAASPDFEPRGVSFPVAPDAMAIAPLRAAEAGAPPVTERISDLAVVESDSSGVPFVRLYENRGNGSFTRLGGLVSAAARDRRQQHGAVDLVAGDFQADGQGDLILVAGGLLTGAEHSLLTGTGDPGRPLRRAGVAFATPGPPEHGLSLQLSGDRLDDVLLSGGRFPGTTSTLGVATPEGGFQVRRLWTGTTVNSVEASAFADLDGDGFQDLLLAAGGPNAELWLLFGPHSSGFAARERVDLAPIPGVETRHVLSLRGQSHAAVEAGAAVMVMTGVGAGNAVTELHTLRPSGSRQYQTPSTVQTLSSTESAVAATFGDLDADGVDELAVGYASGIVQLWQRNPVTSAWEELTSAVPVSPLELGAVRGLEIARVVDSPTEPPALCITHEGGTLGAPGPRLTPLVHDVRATSAGAGLRLVHPTGARTMSGPIRGVALAPLQQGGVGDVHDVVVAYDQDLLLLRNDGFGRFDEGVSFGAQGLLASSMVRVPIGELATPESSPGASRWAVAMLDVDGRIGVVLDEAAPIWSAQRLFDGQGQLNDTSRFLAADVDGDQFLDLVCLLSIDRLDGAREARLLFLPGLQSAPVGELPWSLPAPDPAQVVPADVTDLAAGDFAVDAEGELRLEVALARPDLETGGIAFFRLVDQPGGGFTLAPSEFDPGEPLLGRSRGPVRLLAGDVDVDGFDDLLIVSTVRGTLSVFRRASVPGRVSEPGIVDPQAFAESGEVVVPPGIVRHAFLADTDSDTVEDVILHIQDADDPGLHRVAFFVQNGVGGFASSRELPQSLVGSGASELSLATGDLNGDALPDLLLGTEDTGTGGSGVLSQLFGTWR